MLIPIGTDQGQFRRYPVVTFAIIGLCTLFYLVELRHQKTFAEERELDDRVARSVAYYRRNRDLAADPVLKQMASQQDSGTMEPGATDGQMTDLMDDVKEGLGRKDDEQRELEPRSERQRQLDLLTAAWVNELRSRQIWRWGLIPAEFSVVGLIAHMFIHDGFFHLLPNMVFLYLAGAIVEEVFGRLVFAVLYLFSGLVAGGLWVAYFPNLHTPLVGASGAIAGCIGAALVRFPYARIRVMVIRFRVTSFWVPAWIMIPLWFVSELLQATAAGVANLAHVWGFVTGVAAGGVVRLFKLEERIINPAIDAKLRAAEDPLMHQVDQALTRNDTEEAYRLLGEEIARNPANRDAGRTFLELTRQLGRFDDATGLVLRVIESELRNGDRIDGLQIWRELSAAVPRAAPDPGVAVELARAFRHEGHREEALSLVKSALDRADKRTPPDVLFDIASLASDLEAPFAREARARALAHPSLRREAREQLAQLDRLSENLPM